ncbi:hypothetical protein FSP39_000408 [Pinctada imbricata]|uniref:Little elongation complex subunit 2 C-terminal domain-containing protein n=1 Tax=Pinctada imbricata TaxID=66713 RepID=A0AA88YGF0_PINIB|nr:hypothetical protein FSP39_000408 [Pinctada imbricata]
MIVSDEILREEPQKKGFGVFFTEESYNKLFPESSLESKLRKKINELEDKDAVVKFDPNRKDINDALGAYKWDELVDVADIKEELSDDEGKGADNSVITPERASGNFGASAKLPEAGGKKNERERKKIQNYSKGDEFSFERQIKASEVGQKIYIPPPPKSDLKHQEQRRYLYLFTKYSKHLPVDMTEEERIEVSEYMALKKRVEEEHGRFQTRLENLANKIHKADYEFMHPEAKKYIESYMTHRRKEVDMYPKYYNTQSSFPLQGVGTYPNLVYNGTLLQLGHVPKMVVPFIPHGNQPKVKLEDTEGDRAHYNIAGPTKRKDVWDHMPVSMDNNAEVLVERHHPHVVISSSALRCLIDNHAPKYQREWELPVTVKETQVQVGDKTVAHRTVYIDRPFIPKEINTREKNTKFYKHALQTMITKASQKGVQFTAPHFEPKLEKSADHLKKLDKFDGMQDTTKYQRKEKQDLKSLSSITPHLSKTRSNTSIDQKEESVGLTVEESDLHVLDEKTEKPSLLDEKSNVEDNVNKHDKGTRKKNKQAIERDTDEVHIEDLESFGVGSRNLSAKEKKSLSMKDEDFLKMLTKKTSSFGQTRQNPAVSTCTSSENKEQNVFSVMEKERSRLEDLAVVQENSIMENMESGVVFEDQDVSIEGDTPTVTVDGCDKQREWQKPRKFTDNDNDGESEGQEEIARSTKDRSNTGMRRRCDSSCSNDSEKLVIDDILATNDEVDISETPASPEPMLEGETTPETFCRIIPIDTDFDTYEISSPAKFAECPKSPENVMSDRESPISPEKGRLDLKDNSSTSCPEIPLQRESDLDESFEINSVAMTTVQYEKPATRSRRKVKDVKKERTSKLDEDSDEQLVIDWMPESQESSDNQSESLLQKDGRRKSARISNKKVAEESNDEKKCSSKGKHKDIKMTEKQNITSTEQHDGSTPVILDPSMLEDSEVKQLMIGAQEPEKLKAIATTEIKEEIVCDSPAIQEIFQQVRRSARNKRLSNDNNVDAESKDTSSRESSVQRKESAGSDEELSARARKTRGRKPTIESDSETDDSNISVSQGSVEKRGRGRPRKYPRGRGRRRGAGDARSEKQGNPSQETDILEDKTVRGRGRGQVKTDVQVNSIVTCTDVDHVSNTRNSEETSDRNRTLTRSRSKSLPKGNDLEKTDSLQTDSLKPGQEHAESRSTMGTDKVTSNQVKVIEQSVTHSQSSSSQFQMPGQGEKSGTGQEVTTLNPSPPKRARSDLFENQIKDPLAKRSRVANRPKFIGNQTASTICPPSEKTINEEQDEHGHAAGKSLSETVLPPDKRKTTSASAFSLDSVLQMQQNLLHPKVSVSDPHLTDKLQHEMSKFKVPERHNVTYSLWNLGGFHVIIRAGYHGVVRNVNQQMQFIHLSPKLEFQSDFGMEQLTASELANDWISTYIRPNCKLVRVRVNTPKNEIMAIEELSLPQVITSTQIFNPSNALLMLQNVLHKLHQLEEGKYVLQHAACSNLCNIKKATENNQKRGSYDLHFHHHNVFGVDEVVRRRVPWVPIDPTIILPYHSKNGRIPATFEPEDFRFTQQKKPFKQKNKGKKNKKKKNKNKQNVPS